VAEGRKGKVLKKVSAWILFGAVTGFGIHKFVKVERKSGLYPS